MKVGILVPTLWRPHIMKWFVMKMKEVTPPVYKVYFGIHESDRESFGAALEIVGTCPSDVVVSKKHSANYKLNKMFDKMEEPFGLWTADRIEFPVGWLEYCLGHMEKSPELKVVGIANIWEPNSTCAFFVRRGYEGVVDCPGKLCNDDYEHEFADTEFKHTAIKRGVYLHSKNDGVFATHHTTRYKDSIFPYDETNRKSLDRYDECKELFESRRHLFD